MSDRRSYVTPLSSNKGRRYISDRRSYVTPLSSNKGMRSMSDRRPYITPFCLLDEPLSGTSRMEREREDSTVEMEGGPLNEKI